MARSPLTETYKRVQGMVFYVQENLSSDEYMLFLDMVDPQPDPAPAKKTRKKRTTKSPKAQSLESVIAKTPKADMDVGRAHEIVSAACGVCGNPEDYQDHFRPSPNYHPFDRPAQTAAKRSSRKGAGTNTTANSEIETAAAMSVSGD